MGAGGLGGGAGRAPAPLSGGGGTISPASGGGGRGPRGLRAGGGAGGGVSRRGLPAPLLGGGLRYSILAPFVSPARSLPACACGRGRSAAPGWWGVRGGPWTAPPGALADLNPPSAPPEWAVVTGGSCGARPPYCSIVRVAPVRQCGLAGAGPAAAPPTASPSLLGGGGRPPRLRGGGGPRLWLPSWGGCGGGVGGPPPRPLSGLSGRGGGRGGGPLVPWRRLLTAGGGGAAWQSRPQGPAIGWGVAPFPRPPLPRARPPCRPSLGPLIPPAVVARRWPAGGGREG